MKACADTGGLETGTSMNTYSHAQTQWNTDGGDFDVAACPARGLLVCADPLSIWAFNKGEIKWQKCHLHDNELLW